MATSLAEAALAFLASAGVCLVVGPAAIRWLARAQCLQPDRYKDCPPLQAHQAAKQGTPTMGGLFVLLSAGLVAGAAGGLIHPEGRLIALAIAGLAAVGLFDDYLKFRGRNARGLRALPKLAVALGIGAGIGAAFPLRPIIRLTPMPGKSLLGRLWAFFRVPWGRRVVEVYLGFHRVPHYYL